MSYTLHHGDCLAVLRTLPDASVDAVVTDPPYGLSFMGKRWDYDVPAVEVWAECLRVLKPGGHLLAFAGTRTQHRMAVRIEDAGFDIRDLIAWVYGSGFPKSLDVSKAIDARGGASVAWFGPWFRKWREDRGIAQKQVAALFPSKTGALTGCVANWELGFNMPTPEQFNLIRDTFGLPFKSIEAAEREVVGYQKRGNSVNTDFMSGGNDITAPATDAAKQWQGWGTALKPALEPITVARKPLDGTVAENVLAHGTGALNVDGCRVGTEETVTVMHANPSDAFDVGKRRPTCGTKANPPGRWPANLIHDGSDEVVGLFPESDGGAFPTKRGPQAIYGGGKGLPSAVGTTPHSMNDSGSAARFFYCAKAAKADRDAGCEGLEAKQGCADYRPNDDGTHGLQSRLHGASTKGGNHHPTVKPTDLMRYLCRLVTPPGGVVLDPFTGSGSTGRGAILEGFRFVGIEREADYLTIARARIDDAVAMRASETSQLTML